jgi:hypothetical protein
LNAVHGGEQPDSGVLDDVEAQGWDGFAGVRRGEGAIGGHATLHSNVDRLFAMWQTQAGQDWRLDPDQVYGDQSNTTGPGSILASLQPWDGTVEFGSPIEPWVGASPQIEVKNCRNPSVVTPQCYDTLPLTVEQVAPAPGDPLRFLDVVEFPADGPRLAPAGAGLRVGHRERCCHLTVHAPVGVRHLA